MSGTGSAGYAFNRTRQAYLATQLTVAGTHWSRLRGLMCTSVTKFRTGDGLWIVPCRGVHTFAMRFPIDVLYLDSSLRVVHVEENLQPWRLGKVKLQARSVLELPPATLQISGTGVGDEIEIGARQGSRTQSA